jgi:hypothetical protein
VPYTTKNYAAQNVNSPEVEKPCRIEEKQNKEHDLKKTISKPT